MEECDSIGELERGRSEEKRMREDDAISFQLFAFFPCQFHVFPGSLRKHIQACLHPTFRKMHGPRQKTDDGNGADEFNNCKISRRTVCTVVFCDAMASTSSTLISAAEGKYRCTWISNTWEIRRNTRFWSYYLEMVLKPESAYDSIGYVGAMVNT